MSLKIVHYPDPVLRQKGEKIGQVSPEHIELARQMLETMREANGVGLAAQQIGRALQLAVVDVTDCEQPSQIFVGVKEVPVESLMPLVLINPVIVRQRGSQTGSEGCLSFPGLSANISRYDEVLIEATDLEGGRLRFTCTGLLSRAVQHEIDHLNGVLFVDRMEAADRERSRSFLEELEKKGASAS